MSAKAAAIGSAARVLARIEMSVVAAILLVSLLITLFSIVARNFGYSTGEWTLKLPELFLVWITFLGMGALVTEKKHVVADVVIQRFSMRWQKIAQLLSAVITSLVLSLILVGAVKIVLMQIQIGSTDDALFGLPMAVLLSGLPVFLFLTILHLIVEILSIFHPSKGCAS